MYMDMKKNDEIREKIKNHEKKLYKIELIGHQFKVSGLNRVYLINL